MTLTLSYMFLSNIDIKYLKKYFPSYKITDKLFPHTSYLFTYRPFFSNKYIQALRWNIPIINIQYVFNLEKPIEQYQFKIFDQIRFSISGSKNRQYEMVKNYLSIQGGVYKKYITYETDFIVQLDREINSTFDIPIVKYEDIFLNEFEQYKKQSYLYYSQSNISNRNNLLENRCNENICKCGNNKSEIETPIFLNYTFSLNSQLPNEIFNQLKHLIIEHGGIRLTTDNVDYVIGISNGEISYQFILESIENKHLLRHEPYIIYNVDVKQPLEGSIFAIREVSRRIYNKVYALGGSIKKNIDSTCNYYLGPKKENQFNLMSITEENIDRSLLTFSKIKTNTLNLKFKTIKTEQKISYSSSNKKISYVFQFTNLKDTDKQKAIEKIEKLNYRYIDSVYLQTDCSYLICGNLTFGEKIFCAIAKGIPIVHKDWIKGKNTLKDLIFETGETVLEKNIIKSSLYWRNYLEKKNRGGIFEGWKVYVNENYESVKRESFMRILLFGGAIESKVGYTHYFTNKGGGDKNYEYNFIFKYILKVK